MARIRSTSYDEKGKVVLNRYSFITMAWISQARVRLCPTGNWVRYEDVAPYIKETGKTVRAKRPVQQLKQAMTFLNRALCAGSSRGWMEDVTAFVNSIEK